ncbi:type II toxin-antitoxin system RelE/ParE family toxin [Hymenobacter weizhouensis]|uniref:type II toxin-antitoxin system RelE/ParE family toxin n=1 Tax=Hymenobacter sp. YIM 151500-1 TaxID=2987689 RepID=UPI0022277259|nr:type II toxin-antitoxin system RelE/ParE family toxin [Hymenobacter sp. YIM 151500-1]UYZ64574.1 type II toxin-antitoxin system RelE/ParE family toxin [Hymenobacter sp. YIM 151500-1]
MQISLSYAEQLITRIIAKTDMLAQFPMAGRMVPEYQDETIREVVEGNYRIMYEVLSATRLDITHVHHSARPLPPVS